MSRREEEIPHLDHKIRFAIQAFRQVKPSPALERRLWSVLEAQTQAPERARAKSERGRASSFLPRALVVAMLGLLLASIYGLKLAGRWGQAPGGKPTELAVNIPDDGHAWVELPVSAHPSHPAATVYIDTPASVALHFPSAMDASMDASQPSEPHTVCTEQRCVHRWSPVASAKNRATPRVRISEPGRYEFTMTHVSRDTNRHERIVVHARR